MSLKRELRVAERRRDVAHLYLSGHTQAEIAHKWRVSQQQISLDLKHIHAQWIDAALMSFDEAKARELARIDRVEREYWQAWERSRQEFKRKMVKAKGGADGGKPNQVEKSEHVEERVGDSRYLDGVRWCIEQRLKIFGVYAAEKHEHTWKEYAERNGIDAGAAFEALVQFYAAERVATDARGGAGGSEPARDGER